MTVALAERPCAIRRAPMVITQSDIAAFKVCRRNWYLGTYLGLDLRVQPAFGPLTLGTRVHKALELYYTDNQDPVEAYTQIAKEEYALLEESKILFDHGAWESEAELGRIMVEGYVEWLEETGADADYEILGAEKRLSWIFPELFFGEQVELRGKVDARLRNLRTGARLVEDHKTTAHFSNLTVTAYKNEQLKTYMLLERLAEPENVADWVQGAVFNMLRKVKRGPQSKPPYFERMEVHHNDEVLRSFYNQVYGTIMDYVQTVQRLDAGWKHQMAAGYTAGSQCRYCPFKGPCDMMDDGSRIEDMIETLYVSRDPHARYYEEPADFMEDVASY